MSDDANRPPDTRLHAIAGRWITSGHVIGEPTIPVVGTDIYEVLAGGHFLVHHVDVTVGEQPVRAIEIIGEPDGAGGVLARSFDNEGNAELMHVTIDDSGIFHFAGGPEIAPVARPADAPTAQVRSTLTIAEDRRSMTALWERSRGRHQLAALDGHLVYAERLTQARRWSAHPLLTEHRAADLLQDPLADRGLALRDEEAR